MGKSWMKRLQAYTSGILWAKYLTKWLDRAVHRKTVVAFALAEAVIAVTIAVFLFKARAVSELVHFPLLHSFRILSAIVFFRIFSGIFGAVSAFLRKTSLVRYYWCFLIFNTLTTLTVMSAFKRARCQCTSYWQCQVLFGYMGTDRYTMINPYPSPNEERFEQIRRVPYVDPPVPVGEAEQKWMEERSQQRQAIVSPILLQTRDNKMVPMQVSLLEPTAKAASTAISSSMMEHSEEGNRDWRTAKALKASDFSGVVKLGNTNLSYEAVCERSRWKSMRFATALKDTYAKSSSLRHCCKVVNKYQIVPHRSMGTAPNDVQDWWDRKNCESIVKDAAQCEEILRASQQENENDSDDSRITAEAASMPRLEVYEGTGEVNHSLVFKKMKSGTLPDSTMKYYDIGKKGIAWESTYYISGCTTYSEADVGQLSVLQDGLLGIREGRAPKHLAQTQELFETIVGRLNHCKRKHSCGVVSVRLKAKDTETKENGTQVVETATLQICLLKYPVVPVPATPLDVEGEMIVFFQKDRKAVAAFDQSRQKDRSGINLMKTVLSLGTINEGKAKLSDHFLDSCRCKSYQESGEEGCQAFYDEDGFPSHWCEVSPLSVAVCRQMGMKLFQLGDDAKRFWSADLCQRSSCTCSYIGMTSTSMGRADMKLLANITPSTASRGPNGVNMLMYGSECRNWNKADTQPWCYVGYDSICPDREKITSNIVIPQHLHSPDIPGSVSQYRSTFACVEKAQHEAFSVKKDTCQMYVAIPVGLSAILTLVSVLMIIVVFKFLVRRCGDNFAIEAQFEAYYSSESEAEDDFDVKRSTFHAAKSVRNSGIEASMESMPEPIQEHGCDTFASEDSEVRRAGCETFASQDSEVRRDS